ncbi:MAG: hypothetical protein AB1Z98_09195 [Nannocystaceae bacterium]
MSTRRSLFFVSGVLASSLLAGGCKEDPTTPKLFEEAGAWSLIRYDLEGAGDLSDIDVNNRRDAFLLHFDDVERVVTAAACVDDSTDTPANSSCLLTPSSTEWQCACYGYDFVREQMLWREFEPGDLPPEVSLDDIDQDAGMDSGTGGGTPLEDSLINLAAVPDINSTYTFRPLPEDLFGSNGEDSRYVFEARAGSVFERVYDDPDGRPGCEPCI